MKRTLAVAAALALATVLPAAPANAAPCDNPKDPGEVVEETPWPQSSLAPERVWPFTTGAGVTVAVIDSGTDATHDQLGGRVLAGFDFLGNAPGATTDCVSHGTAVASIIAAQRVQGVGFQGVAPGARILPVRVSDREVDDEGNASGDTVSAAKFAQAITYAVNQGAKVINLSIVLYEDSAAVKAAVRGALARNVVLVAAVGNRHEESGRAGPHPVSGRVRRSHWRWRHR